MAVSIPITTTFDRKGVEQAQAEMAKLSGAVGNTQSKIAQHAKLIAVSVGTAAIGIGIASTMAFVDFEKSMNEVFTLIPGTSQKAMDGMTNDVKKFSKEFGVLPDAVVPALYQSLSAGIPQGNVFQFLETAQKAAKGGVTDLTTAVNGISSVMNAYGADTLSATQASDLMFTAVRMGKTTFGEMSASLFQVTPTAAALGVKFGDVTAALASMTAQGVPTSVATTQLRQLFVELSKEGTKTSDTFEKIAGKSFKKFVAEGGNTQQALQLLEKYAGKTNVGVNDLFGSVEAGSAALSLTGKGTDTFSKNLDEMGKSAGATDGAFEQMNKGLGPLIDKVKAWGSVLLIDIGQKIAPIIIEIAGSFKALFAAFKSGNGDITSAGLAGAFEHIGFVARNVFDTVKPIIVEIIGSFKAFFGAFKAGDGDVTSSGLAGTFERIGNFARDAFDLAVSGIKLLKDNLEIVVPIVGSLSAAFLLYKGYLLATATATKIATAAQGAYNAVLLANPIGLLVVAIALLVAAIIILWRNWDQVFNWIKEHKAFAIIISILGGPILLTVFALVAAGKFLQANWQTIWNAIQTAIQFAWSYIEPVWNGIMSFITNALIPALAFLGEKTVQIWGMISTAIGVVWNGVIKPIWDAIYGFIVNYLIPIFEIWWGVVSTILTYIGEKIQRVWTDIIEPVWKLLSAYIINILVPYLQFLWDIVKIVFSAIGTVIGFVWNTMIKPAFDNIKYGIETVWQFFQTAKDVISTVFSGIADGISSPFREAFNFIARAWNNTVGKLRWTIPRIVPVFGGDTIAAPQLTEFAKGGIFNAGMGGSGLAVLHDNEMVLNAEQQQGLFAGKGVGGGGSVYNINVSVAPTADKAAIGQTIVESIAAYERRSGSNWRAS